MKVQVKMRKEMKVQVKISIEIKTSESLYFNGFNNEGKKPSYPTGVPEQFCHGEQNMQKRRLMYIT